MNISLKTIGLDEALNNLTELPKKVRFAASVGMNRTMSEAQDAIRNSLASRFTVRRQAFILSSVYRKPGEDWATKDSLSAGVRINPARDVLAKFEDGGEKTPTRGRKALAIPIDVRRNKNDIVPNAYRFSVKGGDGGMVALIKSGKAYIRDGKVWLLQGRGKIRKRILAYVFKQAVPIASHPLSFVKTATSVIYNRAKLNIEGAIVQEISGGGLNVNPNQGKDMSSNQGTTP